MSDQEKLDLYKENKDEYIAPRKPSIIATKRTTYLTVCGSGEPGGQEFGDKIGALYAMAFTTKMTYKFDGRGDYKVCKLECQWFVEDEDLECSDVPREEWCWRLMIRTPDFIKKADLKKSIAALTKRGKEAGTENVQLEKISEGKCVQMLHVGPYDKEGETIEIMRDFAAEQGFETHGRHHEIYLSDPRRVEPERLRTILRNPVRKAR